MSGGKDNEPWLSAARPPKNDEPSWRLIFLLCWDALTGDPFAWWNLRVSLRQKFRRWVGE